MRLDRPGSNAVLECNSVEFKLIGVAHLKSNANIRLKWFYKSLMNCIFSPSMKHLYKVKQSVQLTDLRKSGYLSVYCMEEFIFIEAPKCQLQCSRRIVFVKTSVN